MDGQEPVLNTLLIIMHNLPVNFDLLYLGPFVCNKINGNSPVV